jgi:hypothetical protein
LYVAAALALLPACASLAPSSEPREVVRGPLPTRVMLPEALPFPEPRPRRVRTQRLGTFGGAVITSYGANDRRAEVGPDDVPLDGDVLQGAVLARYGFDGNTELEVELATVWAREDDDLGLMDVPVHVTKILRHPAGGLLGMALRAGVELPLGDEDDGTGSGDFDWDLGVLFERSRGRWTLTGGVDLVFVQTPDGYAAAGIAPDDVCIGTFGAEFRWNDHMSLLGGLRYRTELSDDVAAGELGDDVLDVSLGVARDAGDGRWFAAVHTDALGDSGPDVGASLGYTFGF